MKKGDALLSLFFIVLFVPFVLSESLFNQYRDLNKEVPYLLAFIKFFILASSGEILGHRIKTGGYFFRGFGLLPRAIVWGFLGLSIKLAFVIFGVGAPYALKTMGVVFPHANPADILEVNFLKDGSWLQLLTAFTISTTLNIFFAPVFMTVHKITDTHILQSGGKLINCLRPIQIRKIMMNMDWGVQWGFVFKKTLIFFWIPAQTLNFLLPGEYRILVAAFYSIILGVILAIAAQMGQQKV